MKILFVSHEYGVNGATKSLVDMINSICDSYEVEICVLIPRNGNAAELFKNNNIQFKTILYYPDYHRIGRSFLCFWEMIKELINFIAVIRTSIWCKKRRINIIHSNSSAVDIGARVAEKLELPHIYHIREFMEEDFNYVYRNKNRMKKLIERSQYCIFISKAIRNKYIKLYNIEKFSVLYDKIDVNSYLQVRNNLFEDEVIHLIMTGGIVKGKGIHIAVRAVKAVAESGLIKVKLTILGNADKKYLAEIKTYIKENGLEDVIHIGGFTNFIESYRRKADICLVCSDCEGLGRVTIESMLAGLLVIGSNSGATMELIQKGETGMLYKKGDVADLSMCIESVAKNRQRAKTIAQNGQTWAMKEFANTNYAEIVMEIWRNCCGEKIG